MSDSDTSKSKKPLPPTYLFSSLLLMVGLHLVFPLREVIHFPWSLSGCVPLLMGIVLNLVADQAFKRAGTTVKPFEQSSALITGGVFCISRHPMYLGMVLILFGVAMLMGTLTPILVVPVFALLMQYRFIIVEERMLETQFGVQWLDYKSRVRQWI
jgi:protein-S-isoprenylcysteine O-methyltransferase Ste14